jgi:hypothetical protein
MDVPSESNTLAAAVVFMGSIVVDAVTATEPLFPQNAPTSMRTAAVVLIGILAAPPIRSWILVEQRISVCVPLAAVALLGWHEQSIGARNCDALFITVTLGIALVAFEMGGQQGISARSQKALSKDAPPYLRREAMVNFATAQLFYSSFRILRMALRHPDAARNFAVVTTTYNGDAELSTGYAYASPGTGSSLAFGAAAGIGVAVVLLVNKEVRENGTVGGTVIMTTGAFAQLTGAFIATMASSEQWTTLTGIFSSGACNIESVCKAAFNARRFASVNNSPAALWLNGFGTLLLAFAPSLRLKSRAEMAQSTRNFEMTVYAVMAIAVCLLTLFVYLSFTGADAVTDYAVVGAVIAVAVTAFLDSVMGGLLFLICVSADMYLLWTTYGAGHLFGYFTHCCNVTMVLLLFAYIALTATVDFFWRALPQRLVDATDTIAGGLAIAGTSISTLLFLGSCALIASYDGALIDDSQFRAADNRYERTAAAFIMEHWLPVLVWLPLYSCRCEVEYITNVTRAIIWYASILVPSITWFVGLAVYGVPGWAGDWYRSSGFTLSLSIAALIPWGTVVWA